MTETKPLDIEEGRSWLMFTWGAVMSALDKAPDLRDAVWRLTAFISALSTIGERHPDETREVWVKRLGEPMPFGGAPLGVDNALPKPFKEWTRTPSPVPAVEHQADMARRQAYYAALQNDPARRPQSSLEVALSPAFAGHTDTASHQRYRGAEPAVRYVEPHREAFIALYEAAQWVAEEREGGRDTIHAAWRALQGALDKAAPAYGQALVERAKLREADEQQRAIWARVQAENKETGGQ
jgi:hypothetical protein